MTERVLGREFRPSRAWRCPQLVLAAGKWTAIAIWLDLTSRFIGSPLDWLFSQSGWSLWLDGVTRCAQ